MEIKTEKINIWDILFWIIILILFIMIITRIIGSSATDIQIYLGFVSGLIVVAGYILKQMNITNNLTLKVANIENNMKNSFEKVKDDISEIKKGISKINWNIKKINGKLKIK